MITLEEFKTKKAEIDARRASAEQELVRLDVQQQQLTQRELETTAMVDYCAKVRVGLHHFSIDEKYLALRALNITVTWHPVAGLTIQGSIPVDIGTSAPS